MFRLGIVISLLFTLALGCHYSCETCFGGEQFTYCTVCKHNEPMTFVNSIVKDDNSLFKSVVPVGVCTSTEINPLNIYGIIVLVLGALGYILTEKSYSLQYMSTLQNLAFLGLLQISLITPVDYLWQGLRYFLIFTATTSSTRKQNTLIVAQGKYNIQKFARDTTYLNNLPLIIATNALVGLLVFTILLKLCKCVRESPRNCQKILDYVERFAKLGFFYLMAENMWVIMTAFKFGSASKEEYLIFGLYFLQAILFAFYINWEPIKISVNDSKARMYWELLKKVIYPLLTIFNIGQIILPCIMIAMFVGEFVFEVVVLNKRHWKTYLYKSMEGATLLMFALYVVGDEFLQKEDFSEGFAWTAGLTLGLYSCIPIIEIIVFNTKKCLAKNTKGEIVHEMSDNNIELPHNPIRTEISLPDDPQQPIKNPQKVFQMPTINSDVNLTEQDQERENQPNDDPPHKSKLPIKSTSQTSNLKSKTQFIKKQKSQSTKSHRLIINEQIQQSPIKEENFGRSSEKRTIEVIDLGKLLKEQKAVSAHQTREQKIIRNNSNGNKSFMNMYGMKKDDSSPVILYNNPLSGREKRRINRRKRANQDDADYQEKGDVEKREKDPEEKE